jgi:hypothetical protein
MWLQIVSFGCINDGDHTHENSVCEGILIAIKYTLPSIQNILFQKVEGVIRLSVSKGSQFGN